MDEESRMSKLSIKRIEEIEGTLLSRF